MNTKRITLEELSQYFKYRVYEASILLNMDRYELKQLCKSYGIERWPFKIRKFRGIDLAEESADERKVFDTCDITIKRKPKKFVIPGVQGALSNDTMEMVTKFLNFSIPDRLAFQEYI